MNKKTISGLKIITINRKASFNYFFKEIFEAGIVLKGSEIKSVRSGKINIADSYAVDKDGEIFLINSHIPIYKQASYSNHNPYSERKLLLNKREIFQLQKLKNEKNLTIIMTSMYWKENHIKCDIAVGKGKKLRDQREDIKKRDWERDQGRLLKNPKK